MHAFCIQNDSHISLSHFSFLFLSLLANYLLKPGWTMVFKAVSGVGSDVYQLWSASNGSFEEKIEALNVNSSFRNHYKNRLVNRWQTVAPKEVG